MAWCDWRPCCCQVVLIRLINDGFGVGTSPGEQIGILADANDAARG